MKEKLMKNASVGLFPFVEPASSLRTAGLPGNTQNEDPPMFLSYCQHACFYGPPRIFQTRQKWERKE